VGKGKVKMILQDPSWAKGNVGFDLQRPRPRRRR